jgi:hypothetical protein
MQVRKGMFLMHPSWSPKPVLGFDSRVRMLSGGTGMATLGPTFLHASNCVRVCVWINHGQRLH